MGLPDWLCGERGRLRLGIAHYRASEGADDMTVEKYASWLFKINALINWTLSTRAILDPLGMTALFGGVTPNYPFLVRLWAGLVFMFGCMFWETGRDIRAKHVLMKYNWIEKGIVAISATLGYFSGNVPARFMILIMLTNWAWIPFILYFDLAVRRTLQGAKT
jgi:hypothetical protein